MIDPDHWSAVPNVQGLPDAVGSAMMTALQRTLPALCEQVFKTSVLPSFERSCQEMFRQLDGSFRRGTIECKFIPIQFKFARK